MEEIKRKIEIEITDYKTIDGEIYSIEKDIKSLIEHRCEEKGKYAIYHEDEYLLFYDWNNFKFDKEKLKEFNQDTWEHFKYYFFENIVGGIRIKWETINKYNSIKDMNEFIEFSKKFISDCRFEILNEENVKVLFKTGFLDTNILPYSKIRYINFNAYKEIYQCLDVNMNLAFNYYLSQQWWINYNENNIDEYNNYEFNSKSILYRNYEYIIENVNHKYSIHKNSMMYDVLDFFKDMLSIEDFTKTIINVIYDKEYGSYLYRKIICYHFIWNYYKENELGIITDYNLDEFLYVMTFLRTDTMKFVNGEFHIGGKLFTKEVKINKEFIMCHAHRNDIEFLRYNNFDRLDMLFYNTKYRKSLFPFQKDDYNMLFNKIDITYESDGIYYISNMDVEIIEKLIEDKQIVDRGLLCIITKINKIEGGKIYIDFKDIYISYSNEIDITRETFDKLSEKIKADEKKKLLDEKLKEIELEKEKLLQEIKNL